MSLLLCFVLLNIRNQVGFSKFHSTYMALVTLINKSTKCLDSDEYVIGIFLDFEAIYHAILPKNYLPMVSEEMRCQGARAV